MMIRKYYRRILVACALVVGVGVLFYRLDHQGFFNLQKIQMDLQIEEQHAGFFEPLKNQLNEDLKAFENQSLVHLPMGKLHELLASKTWIESFHVQRVWPQTLRVQMRAYQVVGVWRYQKQARVVLSNGQILQAADWSKIPDKIHWVGAEFEKPEVRQNTLKMLKSLPDQGVFKEDELSEIQWNQKEGYKLIHHSGVVLKKGFDQFPLKAARIQQVVDYLESHNTPAQTIDASLRRKVLVKTLR